MSKTMLNGLSFDVEDWFHGLELAPSEWEKCSPRLNVGLERILGLLRQHRVHATFFVLGVLVERWHSLLARIAAEGHEIGVHGFGHKPVYRLTPQAFVDDVQRTLEALRGITDQSIVGYRAPFFSITKTSLWALSALSHLGFRYDASIVPAYNPRYGIPNAPRWPHLYNAPSWPAPLAEYPLSTLSIGPVKVPFSGGFYARLFPYGLTRRWVTQLNRQNCPAIVYFHPWEFDPDHPRVKGNVSLLFRFTHYHRLYCTVDVLHALLRDFAFAPLANLPVRMDTPLKIDTSRCSRTIGAKTRDFMA